MKMKVLIKIAGLLLLCGTATFGWGTQTNASNDTDKQLNKIRQKLDAVMLQYKETLEVPGFSIGILEDNKVIYAKAFGVRSLDSKEPVTTRSLFHMSSVSTPFVATAVMQLTEKGKIKLEGKLVDYLPYFKIDDQRYKDITIGQILSHTSGLPDVRDYQWDKPQYDDGAAERYIRSLTKEKLIADPGKTFRYSNMAYNILADVIARTSGMTFETYMKENIFKPLGMNDSTFLKKEVPQELGNTAHLLSRPPDYKISVSKIYPYNRVHASSSTLHSNVEDMLKWAKANLNRGILKNKRILQTTSHQQMWTPQVKGIGGNANRAIGLSWAINIYKGHQTISIGGADVGFRTTFIMLPQKSIAVIAMGNANTFSSRRAAFAALDILLGEEPGKPRKPIAIPVGRMIGKKGAKAAVELYHQLKKNNPGNYYFNESMFNGLGYALVNQNKIDDALEIFELNVSQYPHSWNVYDSLAETYLEKGNKEMAIKNYRKAVELNPKSSNWEKKAFTNQLKILEQLKEEK
jgi:CubicO group peptidase (beta-lactamase class C family)